MKKTKTAKIFAILALLGIIISIVGTGILVLTSPSHQPEQPTFNQEELQKLLQDSQVKVTGETSSGTSIEITQ